MDKITVNYSRFIRDVVCQKLLQSASVSQSYSESRVFSETGCNNNNVKHSVFSAVVFDSFRLETNCRPPCGIAAAVTDVRKRNGMRFLSCRIRQQRSPGVVGAVLKQTGTAQWPDL